MRSKVAKKIQSETAEGVRKFVRLYVNRISGLKKPDTKKQKSGINDLKKK